MFDTVEQAAKDPQVQKAVIEASSEVSELKTKLTEAEKKATDAEKKATEMEEAAKAEKAEKSKRERNEKALVKALEANKLDRSKYVSAYFEQLCLEQEDDKRPDNFDELTQDQRESFKTAEQKIGDLVKERAKEMKAVVEAAAKKTDTGNSRSALESGIQFESDEEDEKDKAEAPQYGSKEYDNLLTDLVNS